MVRPFLAALAGLFFLAACDPGAPSVDRDGFYRPGNESRVQFRMLDAVNALRSNAGVGQLSLNSQLNAAAATHSRDMAVQNRPWHFGSDGSSPFDRVRRVGYTGRLVGENISETFETELETLTAWMELPETRETILAADANEMGFGWFQDEGGKIWWTLVTGAPGAVVPAAAEEVVVAALEG